MLRQSPLSLKSQATATQAAVWQHHAEGQKVEWCRAVSSWASGMVDPQFLSSWLAHPRGDYALPGLLSRVLSDTMLFRTASPSPTPTLPQTCLTSTAFFLFTRKRLSFFLFYSQNKAAVFYLNHKSSSYLRKVLPHPWNMALTLLHGTFLSSCFWDLRLSADHWVVSSPSVHQTADASSVGSPVLPSLEMPIPSSWFTSETWVCMMSPVSSI